WTYGRLSYRSGYGAGVESPGWYHHLWTARDSVPIRWMARVARLLREEDLDVSSAHVIEAVRLAETLAALRDRPLPGLSELNEATQSVFCFGNDLPLRLIHEKLIVGETLGSVPEETPLAPLQQDLAREQKRLRLPAEALERMYDLDLRKPNDLDRSRLLHRLSLLSVGWGETQRAGGKGTFHEIWRLRWEPELVVALIEAGVWGNTIYEAATAFARDVADRAKDLPGLADLLDKSLLADLPGAGNPASAALPAGGAAAGGSRRGERRRAFDGRAAAARQRSTLRQRARDRRGDGGRGGRRIGRARLHRIAWRVRFAQRRSRGGDVRPRRQRQRRDRSYTERRASDVV